MAKRFTDTEKWNKHFVRDLQAPYKLLWLFICDECSTAGIWEVDIAVAQIKLGVKLKKETALASFAKKIIVIDGGKKWFIPGFIEFQYGKLSDKNKAHTKAIFALKKFDLINDDFTIKGDSKPLASPLQGAKVEVEVEEEIKEEVMVEEEVKEPPNNFLIQPFNSETFLSLWGQWKVYRKEQHQFTYKSLHTEQAALKELTELSDYNETTATKIIQQSISNGWKGFFKLKDNAGNSKTGTGPGYNGSGNKILNEDSKRELAERMASLANNRNYDANGSP